MKKLALASLLFGAAYLFWHHDSDNQLVFDRFWVDHAAKNQNDEFFALMVNGEHPFGHFATQTPWRGKWEGFHYHVIPKSDGELELMFPASNQHERVRFRARRCNEQGFDYCLEVSGNSRGVQRYYSRRAWDREDVAMRDLHL